MAARPSSSQRIQGHPHQSLGNARDQIGMTTMEVHVDRPSFVADRADASTPVENRDGVFALLSDDEMSAPELLRRDGPAPAPKRSALGAVFDGLKRLFGRGS